MVPTHSWVRKVWNSRKNTVCMEFRLPPVVWSVEARHRPCETEQCCFCVGLIVWTEPESIFPVRRFADVPGQALVRFMALLASRIIFLANSPYKHRFSADMPRFHCSSNVFVIM